MPDNNYLDNPLAVDVEAALEPTPEPAPEVVEEVTSEVTPPKRRGRPPKIQTVVMPEDQPEAREAPESVMVKISEEVTPDPAGSHTVSARTLAEIEAGKRALARLRR